MTGRDIAGDLRGLLPDGADDLDAREEIWARAVWTMLAEPGDGTAGELVGSLGADAALSLVRRETSPGRTEIASVRPSDAPGAAALRDGLTRWRPRLREEAIPGMFAAARHAGLSIVAPGLPTWPERLDALGAHAPLLLWMRGGPDALQGLGHTLAMVGARAATGYGEHVAVEIAAGVAERGVHVVSGAAYGIDGAAHRACIATGAPTLAVLAGGVDRPYPRGHTDLLHRIAVDGAVLSETPPGAEPTKWRFLSRNRLIAALGDATLVVEAGWRSGSLNTAGHAAALGRPVGAVPGPITSAASAGCHRLLREYAAQCVTGVDDALELIGWETPDADDDPRRVAVLAALSSRIARHPGELSRRTGMPEPDIHAALGLLELEGLVARVGGGWIRSRR